MSRLRSLPSIQRLVEAAGCVPGLAAMPHAALVAALRDVVAQLRAEHGEAGAIPDTAAILARAAALLAARRRPVLRRVINATGIVLHTNLGRAPMAAEAVAAVAEVMAGYCNLEFDLAAGERGARTQGIEPLLRELAGAEACVAVNNTAAAMLLALTALAGGGEVIVSRGELVEIGGGFRIPDIIRQGGARLVEVGTTNKTRLADYRDAITPATRMLLKVHQSNFRIVGFTAEAGMGELRSLAHDHGLLLMHDLGSGTLLDLRTLGRPHEPTVGESLASADLVAFSTDKLLGGPQAGIVAGTSAAIEPLRKHPLMRALRLDKMVLAALEATLRLYRDGDDVRDRVPVLRMLGQQRPELLARAARLRDAVAHVVDARVEDSTGYAGGGALPMDSIPSAAISLAMPTVSAADAARSLREGDPAIVGRITGGRLILDMLTLADAEIPVVAAAVRALAR
jgi:L-seryl-tRNA(Ser) seleniumtransferase